MKRNRLQSQKDMIRDYLLQGHRLTRLYAAQHFGCYEAPTRIFELKEDGYNVVTEMKSKDGARWAEWFIPVTNGQQRLTI